MAKIKISDLNIEAKDIDINPFVDDKSNIVFESILVNNCKELPVFLKEKAYYDGEITGENEETGKQETHVFKHYKLESLDGNNILLIHPDFAFKYELEIYAEKKPIAKNTVSVEDAEKWEKGLI